MSLSAREDSVPLPNRPAGGARLAAIAVTVLAVLVVSAEIAHAVLLRLTASGFGPPSGVDLVVEGFYLVTTSLGILLAASAVWLLQASRREGSRLGVLALLALGLLVIAQLLRPVRALASELLSLVMPDTGPPVDVGIGWVTGAQVLLTVVVAVVAIVCVVRPATSGVRVPVPVPVLAAGLVVAAVLRVASGVLDLLAQAGEWSTTASVLSAFAVAADYTGGALVLAAAGLLAGLTQGRSRLLAWIALAADWVLTFGITLLVRVLVLSGHLGAMEAMTGLFPPANLALRVLTGLVLAVVAVLLVVMARRRRQGSGPSPAPPASKELP